MLDKIYAIINEVNAEIHEKDMGWRKSKTSKTTKCKISLVHQSTIEHKLYKIDNLFLELCNNYIEFYVSAIFVVIDILLIMKF